MKKLFSFCMLVALLFVMALPAAANVQPSNKFYVSDYANVISEDVENYICELNATLERDFYGAQFVVVTVTSFDGMYSDEYAIKLFNEWGIGDAGQGNGILLVYCPSGGDPLDDTGWLMSGDGISGDFTDRVSERYMNDYFWKFTDDRASENDREFDEAFMTLTNAVALWFEDYYSSSSSASPGNSGSSAQNSADEYNTGYREGHDDGYSDGYYAGYYNTYYNDYYERLYSGHYYDGYYDGYATGFYDGYYDGYYDGGYGYYGSSSGYYGYGYYPFVSGVAIFALILFVAIAVNAPRRRRIYYNNYGVYPRGFFYRMHPPRYNRYYNGFHRAPPPPPPPGPRPRGPAPGPRPTPPPSNRGNSFWGGGSGGSGPSGGGRGGSSSSGSSWGGGFSGGGRGGSSSGGSRGGGMGRGGGGRGGGGGGGRR